MFSWPKFRPLLKELEQRKFQGPVIQSIVSLASSLKGQLVKCLTTL